MRKTIKIITLFVVTLLLGVFLVGCGEKEDPKAIIETFDFKETGYEIKVEDRVTVELLLDELVVKENVEYASTNPEVATFVKGILKGVSVGETTITISYKDVDNDLSKTITVKVTLSPEEQANYDAAKEFDAKVEAFKNFTGDDVQELKKLIFELDYMDVAILKYVAKGEELRTMYDKARALAIDDMIEALPEVITPEHATLIQLAKEAYKKADESVKKQVTKHDVLVAKEEALNKAIWDATPDQLTIEFEEEDYVRVNSDLIILASTYKNDPDTVIVWKSSNKKIATVEDGVVTGKKPGTAVITATIKGTDIKQTLTVTVVEENMSEIMELILKAHNQNVFYKPTLRIGIAGSTNYFTSIYGSVSDLLFNYDYYVDKEYYSTSTATGTYNKNEVGTNGAEFITVHYTGNMNSGADADNNASYFAGSDSVSIHYVTGVDSWYSEGVKASDIYQLLDHSHGAYHAGDSSAREKVGAFEWIPTGVKYDGADLLKGIEVTISNDFYYEINGQKTSIAIPKTYDYNSRGTDHIFNADGTLSSNPLTTLDKFSNRTPESFINDQGLPVKVVNGEYYMGTTWWCYTQVAEGRICGTGGNRNSVGIESCVHKGSDLWRTWQVTAQLVAHLMEELELDITRVKGHHFYTAKNCPQPLIANNQEIWWHFIDMVQAENTLLTKYSDYTVTFESHNPEYVDNYGRVIKADSTPVTVSYTVTVTKGATKESMTLYSVIPAIQAEE